MSCNNQARGLNYTQRIIQGDSFDKSYTGSDVNDQGVSVPLDLSNKTIRGQIRLSVDDENPIEFLTSTFDSGTGTIDTFRLQLTSSQTTPMAGGTWLYDVDVVDNTNPEIVETYLKGNFVVRDEITR